MNVRILFLIFCLFQAVITSSQETELSLGMGNLNMKNGLTFDTRYEGVKGSACLLLSTFNLNKRMIS